MKRILLSTLICGVVSASERPVMSWSFNRTNHTFQVQFPVEANRDYGLVRYDLKNKYYDFITNQTFTASGTGTFFLNPNLPSDTDQPTPSGQCWFYLVVN